MAMPLRRSLLISALLHSMLLWGAFATYLPLHERIFLVEIAEAPSSPETAGTEQSSVKDSRPATGAKPRPTAPVPPQDRRQTAEPPPAGPESLPRPLPTEAAVTGTLTMEEARPATGVSAAPTSAHPGGAGQGTHEGRPLVVYSGNAGNSEHLLSQLRARIERSLVYPPLARKRKMEGTATVSFVVGDGGVPAELRLVRSSGHRLLDDEAMNTVRRASPLPVLKGTVEIPIRFSLL